MPPKPKTMLIGFDIGTGMVNKIKHRDGGPDEFNKLLSDLKALLEQKAFGKAIELLAEFRPPEDTPQYNIRQLSLKGLKQPPSTVLSYSKNPDCYSLIVGGVYYEI